MSSSSFWSSVSSRAATKGSYLCVGLDPHEAASAEAAYEACSSVIEETAEYACCFKPNSAFFEVHGGPGIEALKRVVEKCHEKGAPVLLDCKRGDVGSTAQKYAETCFDLLQVDAVTLSPYLGWDAIKPFANYEGKGLFILCATSNPSAGTVQTPAVRDAVARMSTAAGAWGAQMGGGHPLGLVVGATDVAALRRVRELNDDAWILAPGVGAQGGDLADAVRAGRAQRKDDPRLIVPVSRGIANADDRAAKAKELRDGLNDALGGGLLLLLTGKDDDDATSERHHQKQPPAAFVEAALGCGALKFGDFTLKSGRLSPYFFNAGLFSAGSHVNALFDAYAARVARSGVDFDVIFGPAYKGIPLCAGVAAALARDFNVDVAYAYDRKEAKDHGEGGTLVGADVRGKRVLLIDDVISAGTAIREAASLLVDKSGATLVAACVALDRQEVTGGKEKPPPDAPRISAVDAAAKDLGCPVIAILSLTDLLNYLVGQNDNDDPVVAKVRQYRADYGAAPSNNE